VRCNGAEVQSRDAIERSDALSSLWGSYRGRLQEARASAQANIDKLIAAGILVEATGQKRNRIYVAREIVAAIEKSEG